MTDTPSPGGGSQTIHQNVDFLAIAMEQLRAAEARAAMLREALELSCSDSLTFEDIYGIRKVRAATDADVTAWLQARERAAAEKVKLTCASAVGSNANRCCTCQGPRTCEEVVYAIDVDAVLKGG